jgi:hypothetical protein
MTSPELSLICQSLRIDNTSAAIREVERITASDIIDWKDVLNRAEQHRIRPLLEILLKKVAQGKIPEYVLDELNEEVQENLLRQLRNLSEFFRVVTLFGGYQITTVPFKGFWLAHEVYGNIGHRESSDVDLLININELDRLIDLMPILGYEPETSISRRFIEREKKLSTEFNFDKRENNIVISHFEFHWGIGSSLHGLDICLDDLASQVIKSSLQGNSFKTLTLTANFLLAIMHHGGKDNLVEFRHILDIGLFLKRQHEIDWEWVIKMSRRFNIEKQVYTAIRLAADLTGVAAPMVPYIGMMVDSGFIKRLAANRMRQITLSPGQKSAVWYEVDNLIFQLRSRTGIRVRLLLIKLTCMRILIRHVVPSRLHLLYQKMKEKRFAA